MRLNFTRGGALSLRYMYIYIGVAHRAKYIVYSSLPVLHFPNLLCRRRRDAGAAVEKRRRRRRG